MIGLGAMLHVLSGGTKHEPSEYVGQKITYANLDEDALVIHFENGKKIKLFDNGQSCCEHRYMRTDDDVSSLVGGNLLDIVEKEAKDEPEGEYGECHEIVFLEIQTDKGFITISNHNEHSGYYGGFGLTIEEI